MGKFISTVVGVIGALWLLFAGMGAMYWWDRRPPHTPVITLWFFHWSPPDSIGSQLKLSNVRLDIARNNEDRLSESLEAQNDAIQSLRDKSQNIVQGTIKARDQASSQRVQMEHQIDRIMSSNAKSCAEAENLIRETVK